MVWNLDDSAAGAPVLSPSIDVGECLPPIFFVQRSRDALGGFVSVSKSPACTSNTMKQNELTFGNVKLCN
jgi:hypothetical protein